jgi:hypothetical protein
LFIMLSCEAVEDHAWTAATILDTVAVLLVLRMLQECAGAMATILRVLKPTQEKEA